MWSNKDVTESFNGIHATKRILIFTISKDNIEQVPLGSKKGKIADTKPKWTSNL